jgi:hypothetical protein
MTCWCCFADVASTTMFCPYCGERARLESGPTTQLVQERGTTVLEHDNPTKVLSDEQARVVLRWLTGEREKPDL